MVNDEAQASSTRDQAASSVSSQTISAMETGVSQTQSIAGQLRTEQDDIASDMQQSVGSTKS